MKIALGFDEKTQSVIHIKDYSGITEKGQVAHFIAELESMKVDLLEIWDKMNGNVEEEE